MAFDYIAIDNCGMAGCHILWQLVLDLNGHNIISLDINYIEFMFFQVRNPFLATAASGAVVYRNILRAGMIYSSFVPYALSCIHVALKEC